jgi:glutaredoxin
MSRGFFTSRSVKITLTAAVLLATAVPPADAECGSRGVYIFSAYWCPVCRTTEQFLERYGVNYQRLETTNKPDVQEFMRHNFGTTAIPVVVVDSEFLVGFDAFWLRAALCIP